MEILFEKGIPGFENYRYFNVNIVEGNKKIYNIVSKEDSNSTISVKELTAFSYLSNLSKKFFIISPK